MKDVTIPAVGMAMTEALLVKWLKQPGEQVAEGEPIAEIETDKATMDLESPAAGAVGPHLFGEGVLVPIAAPICQIIEAGESAVDAAVEDGVDVGATDNVAEPNSADRTAGFDGVFNELSPALDAPPTLETPRSGADYVAEPRQQASVGERRTPHTSSPRQRRFARLAAEEAERTASTTKPSPPSRRRAAIAARVSESWRTIPHFAVSREIDATAAVRQLQVQREAIPDATMTDLLLHAFATAVISLPGVTSGDVGLAVATPDGVMMPVIERADALTVAALVAARQAATRRAREGRLVDVDFVTKPGGSLSNLGTLGVDSFTGIVPLGQLCLLTVGQIKLRAVASSDGGFSLRDTVHATLNVDHRMIDGDVAARALNVFATTFGSQQTWMKGEQL